MKNSLLVPKFAGRWVLAAMLSLAAAAAASAATPTGYYTFQNTRNSSVAPGPALTDLVASGQTCPNYCNGFVSDTIDGESKTVLQFPANNGLALQPTTSVLSNSGIYTIEVLFK